MNKLLSAAFSGAAGASMVLSLLALPASAASLTSVLGGSANAGGEASATTAAVVNAVSGASANVGSSAGVSGSVGSAGVSGSVSSNSSNDGSNDSQNSSSNSNSASGSVSLTNSLGLRLKLDANLPRIKDRADQEIDRRINALEKISARVGKMAKASGPDGSSLSAGIQDQVGVLSTLKAKVDADTSTTTLKADTSAVTDSYAVFALTVPKALILATADRVNTLSALAAGISAKLKDRIASAQAAGADVRAMMSVLADLNAKTSAANARIQTAETESTAINLNQNDQAAFQASKKTLLDAEGKVKSAIADLKAVQADIKTLIQSLEGSSHTKASATTTASANASL